MNSEFVTTRHGLALGKVLQAKTDTPVAIRIRNKAGLAVTSVTVTTATNIVLIDSAGTTTVTFATDDTVAKVAARINATTSWECKVLDALLSQASASQFVTGAITSHVLANGVTVWDVLQDTSAALEFIACATVDRNIGSVLPASQHRVHLRKFNYAINMGTAAVDSVQVWLRKGSIEEQLIGNLSVDTTATTVFDFSTSPLPAGITAPEGSELICLVKDAATLADSTSNILNIEYIVE